MCSFAELLEGVQVLSLVPIAGGTVTLGALVAPKIFKELGKKEASQLMIGLFTRFDEWLKISAGALLGSHLIQVLFVNKFNFHREIQRAVKVSKEAAEKAVEPVMETVKVLDWSLVFPTLLVLAISGICFYQVFRLSPELATLYKSTRKRALFNEKHRISEILAKAQFVLALILLLLL